MPNRGMQVDPAYDNEGNYAGSVIVGNPRDNAVDNSGRVKGWEQDYFQDYYDQVHHHFENVELQDESSPQHFEMSDYEQALVESIPNLVDAINWAESAANFTDEELEAYNQALDNQDLGAINAFYERLMPLYYQALEEAGETPEESVEDDSEVDLDSLSDDEFYQAIEAEGIVDETLDELIDPDYSLDEDAVDQLETVTSVFDEGTCEHHIAAAGIAVANGKITMEEAITLVTEQFGDAQAAKAYFELQSILG